MNVDPTILFSAFLIGFLGSAHCFGMCGGLASAFGLSSQQSSAPTSSVKRLLSYNLGRIFSYCIAALVLGFVGSWLSESLNATQILRYFAALMLILMGIYIAGWFNGLLWIEKLGHGIWQKIQPLGKGFLPIDKPSKAFAIGMIWGWLPCGLVYSSLIWSSGQGSALHAMLLMLCFGLGTLPAMLATGMFAAQLSSVIRSSWFRTFSGMLMVLFGLWSLPAVQIKIMQILM